MRYLPFLLLLFLSKWSFAQTVDVKQIDALLEEVEADGPGVIIGVVKDQELLHTASKGMANLDYQIPISTSSNFRLSSTSKQFTAACILHLVDQGRLELEDTLGEFFPAFAPDLKDVTIRQLLHHTSGIRDYMGLLMVKGSRQMDFFNSFIGQDGDIMDLLAQQQDLSFPRGSAHAYSNTNYWLLAQIVSRVSGKSLGAYAQENIFAPLGMKTTGFLEVAGQIVPQRVAGYVSECPSCDRLEYRFQSTTVGDDGLVSNIQDLLLWEREFHQRQLLSESLWDNMLTKGQLNNGEEISYASGLIIEDFSDEPMVLHSGQNPGFASEIIRFPDRDLSIIVLGNQNWYDIRRYANEVARLFFPAAPQRPNTVKQEPPVAAALTMAELEQFCGNYLFTETNEYRAVELIDTELVYVRNNGPSSKLIPISSTTLTFADRPHIRLHFRFQEAGKKQIKWEDPNVGTMHAQSYEKLELSPAALRMYTGSYFSTELQHEMKIEASETGLQLFLAGRQFPMQVTKEDEFEAMGVFTLRFTRDEAQQISGLRLDAPRAGNLFFGRK